jgi:transaldolase
MPPLEVLAEIDRTVDFIKMEETLMAEGLQKFADPHKGLLALIGEKRKRLASA